ncbi:MAG: glycosyltransferase [Deltaproteobacteria bacterium]|nr:MAG: glycosyltransferase [Deltaproteobacteria bacterium]
MPSQILTDLNLKRAQVGEVAPVEADNLRIAMLSIHSSPIGELGTKDTGGMSVYVREIARELGNRGHLVDIYTRLNDARQNQMAELYENVRLIHLRSGNNGHMNKLALYAHLDDFLKELEGFRTRESIDYDLIHSHYWLSGRVGNWAQERWEVPHVFMFHTVGAVKNNTVGSEREPELRTAIENHLARNCDRILVATDKERVHLMQHYGAAAETIGVVPCGVNLDLFRPLDKKKARQQLGFGQDESIVLFVGRFAPLKGIDRLLEAVAHLQHYRRFRLVIVGGDGDHTPESKSLRSLSRELGIQDFVTFVGRIEQEKLPPYYSAADVSVVPSHYESFGLVALESLASGTPVVATKVGAMESILREGETGLVVENCSPRLLANGIETFISRSHFPSADAIRATVLEFSWASVASAMMNEYAAVLRQYNFETCCCGKVSMI